MFLKYVADGLDVEFRRQVHHRKIFVVEGLDDFGLFLLALGEMMGEIDVLLDVALEIHRDKGGELHEAGIDLAERALALHRHVVDQVLLEPFDRLALGEFVDLGRLDAGVDRAGHQGQGRGARRMIVLHMIAAAASADTDGWQIATMWARGPSLSRKVIRCSVYSSRPNLP